jgi:hypothetical protein
MYLHVQYCFLYFSQLIMLQELTILAHYYVSGLSALYYSPTWILLKSLLDVEIKLYSIITLIIHHELGLKRPILASSNSLLKSLLSCLHPFGQ